MIDTITLPKSKQELSMAELLSTEAIGGIEPLKLNYLINQGYGGTVRWSFTLYVRDGKQYYQRMICNTTKENAKTDLYYIMSHHPKL